jgi:hypothetical protein
MHESQSGPTQTFSHRVLGYFCRAAATSRPVNRDSKATFRAFLTLCELARLLDQVLGTREQAGRNFEA